MATLGPAATSTTALFRSGAGCIDTNVNGADFATGTPSPRTSSSPLNPCPTGTTVELSLDTAAGSEAAAPEDRSIVYASARRHAGAPPAEFRATYRPTGPVAFARPGTLERFLVERYRLQAHLTARRVLGEREPAPAAAG